MILFPRLSKLNAERRLDQLAGLSVKKLRITKFEISDQATFAQTGGQRISEAELAKIWQSVTEIAKRFGFPEPASEKKKAEFDAICAVWLRTQAKIEVGEGFRDSVWAFLTIDLLPDVAAWRFPNRNSRRFLGGMRNTFQRLWRRAFLLDHEEDAKTLRGYLTELHEDSFVQLVERPGSSANPYTASRIAAAWVRASKKTNGGPMEGTHRKVMKELTQIGAVICLDYLPEAELDSLLDNLYVEFGSKT
jgi:hypothetical protein